MTETAIFNATGQVFTYSLQTKNWVPSSNVPATLQMYFNSGASTYRVIGRAGDDPNNFLINFAVKSDVVYSRASEIFHQFTDQRTHFGINFTSKNDADTFGSGFENVLKTLKSGPPQQPPPQQPKPQQQQAPQQQPPPQQRPPSQQMAKPVAPQQAPPQSAPTPPAAPPAPPKPPGPPPPPPAPKVGGGAGAAGRTSLLGSIEGFSKAGLKKTVTVDKSCGVPTKATPSAGGGDSAPSSAGSTPAATTPKVTSSGGGGGGGGDLMAEVMAKRAKMKAAASVAPKEEPTPAPVADTPKPQPTSSYKPQSFNKPASKPAPPPSSSKPSLSPSSSAPLPSTVANEDLQSLKEEILVEVRKMINSAKDEILEAIRSSAH